MRHNSSQITKLLKSRHNIDIARYDINFLDKSFNNRMIETGCKYASEYSYYLEDHLDERKIFLASLNISYSEFFRNSLTFSALERIIIPLLVLRKKDSKRKEIRIWSMACAAGQEVYSLAILLEEFMSISNEKINYRIFATDQSEEQVDEARKGNYSADSINNLNLKRVKQWFTKHGDTYTAKQELKKNIDFSVFDLFSEELACPPLSIFGDFDLVICANLLFYYKNEYRKLILQKAGNCLTSRGVS
jgi:chemotaxis protein methyltransferase CheR